MRLVADPVGVCIWLSAGAAALTWGGRPERLTATVLLVELAAVCLLPNLSPRDEVHWWTLFWDTVLLGAMIYAYLRNRRAWLVAAIGFQFVAILAHAPRILDQGVRRWAYIAATTYAGYAVVLALVAGTLAHQFLKAGTRRCSQA